MIELHPILESVVLTAIRSSTMACGRADELEEEYRAFFAEPQFKRRIPIKDKKHWFTVESGQQFLYREHVLDLMSGVDDEDDDDEDLDDTLDEEDMSKLRFYQLQIEDGPIYYGSFDPLDLIDLEDAYETGILQTKTWMDVILVNCGFFVDPNEKILFPQ
ncbi:hypothetical protein [Pseudomonas phage PA1C]|uniref:Uncharacterized protein n=1 Tax=Pseudomonas phage vB_PaeM_PS119XW TaxID=2601632 RepID=A0A5C1K7U5_9CAUD|nr:hypothetical protein PP933_gp297 [Pseudomonas phage vB_PaeM_PS119XW]QBX32454.1 hypothetical protein [Pseudomonas phage PA1C]QEM42026.1 hypothetical protein [Pseudomonas phage vB_PaeM_PS119XW]